MPPKPTKPALDQPDIPAEEAAELRGRLAHQHAGHEWVIRHMPAHPELIGPDVLVADDELVLGVDVR